jgi:phage gp36-like protein
MPYSALADIYPLQLDEATLIQLTNDAGNAETIDEDVVARAIADADATINAYCQGRYAVPLSPIPDKIRQIGVDIAIYNLYSRRGDTVPDNRKERYKDAVRFLERISDGKGALGALAPAQTNTDNTVNIAGNNRLFTRDKMRGL